MLNQKNKSYLSPQRGLNGKHAAFHSPRFLSNQYHRRRYHTAARIAMVSLLAATLALSLLVKNLKKAHVDGLEIFSSDMRQILQNQKIMSEGEMTVCLISNDFRGLPNAAGTATAFELLAKALQEDPRFRVVLIAAPMRNQWQYEAEATSAHELSSFKFVFLGEEWQPWRMTDTYPWESAGMAVMNWLLADQEGCSIVHLHEWGGLAAPSVVFSRFGGFKPGVPMVVQEHGGHRWSTQLVIPEEDPIHLRIDAAEKTAIELADAITSPSSHMLNWYADRGWSYPRVAEVVPNVLDTKVDEPTGPIERPVWQLIFFGRLEIRKGLKLFVEALRHLPISITSRREFRVVFLGAEGVVEDIPSPEWINMQMDDMDIRYQIISNAGHEDALEVIRSEGSLIVFCSIQENAPYAVMEASLEQVPFTTFKVGGIPELLNVTDNSTMIPFHPHNMAQNIERLSRTLAGILEKGKHWTTPLNRQVVQGKSIWREWHLETGLELARRLRLERASSIEKSRDEGCSPVYVYNVTRYMFATDIYEKMCSVGDSEDNVLLMPRGMEFSDSSPFWKEECRKFESSFDDVLSFGVFVNESERVSFATNPTWTLYKGLDERGRFENKCSKQIPLFAKRQTICRVWRPVAGNFVTYSSWSLILMLKKASKMVLTYPMPLINLLYWQDSGASCFPSHSPEIEFENYVPANLRSDPQDALIPWQEHQIKPLADLRHDLDIGSVKHWSFGYGKDPVSTVDFERYSGGHRDHITLLGAVWTCAKSFNTSSQPTWAPVPSFHNAILHPCIDTIRQRCCGGAYAPAHLSFNSWFSVTNALLIVSIEASPLCGDGLVLQMNLVRNTMKPLVFQESNFEMNDTSHRETFKFLFPRILADDRIVASVYPKDNHNCDGIYFSTFQIWLQEDAEQLSLGAEAKILDLESLSPRNTVVKKRPNDNLDEIRTTTGLLYRSDLRSNMNSSSSGLTDIEDNCEADSLWMQASIDPKLCPDSKEHGIFNLESLRSILNITENCGSYCVFMPVDEIAPPSSSIGWALQVEETTPGACWKEVSTEDGCFTNYEDFKIRRSKKTKEELRSKLLGLDIGRSPANQGTHSGEGGSQCDLLLSPEEYPPSGFCGPRVLIIGAMKCGTNMLGRLLQRHPSVALKYGKPGERVQGEKNGGIWEIHHFTHKGLFKGIDPLSPEARMRYADTIAQTNGVSNLTFDKSPSYLDSQYHTGIAAAAKKLLPNARIVASVCDPAKRFWSHYNHLVRWNLSNHLPNTFEEVVESAIDPRTNSISKEFFETGIFAPHLMDWIAEFGREAVLVVTDDELETHQADVAHRLIEHVGLSFDQYPGVDETSKAFKNNLSGYSRDKIPEAVAGLLYEAYDPSLLWLSEIIDQKEDVMSWRMNNV